MIYIIFFYFIYFIFFYVFIYLFSKSHLSEVYYLLP